MPGFFRGLLPRGLKHGLKMNFLRSIVPQLAPMLEEPTRVVTGEVLREKGAVLRKGIVPELYDPFESRSNRGTYHIDAATLRTASPEGRLPVPPPALRQGYSVDSEEGYIEAGSVTARCIREIFGENGVAFDGASTVLDWGCAAGRVLRHFEEDARGSTFWGVDQDERCILWNRANLHPPFRFVTCTAYPHLPFEDNTFTHIYGISIFTHIVHLADVWLMELRRVLKPGGHLLVTVHTEAATEEFERGYWPPWLSKDTDLEALRQHDATVVTEGTWDNTYPFYREAWLRSEWGQFMKIVDLRAGYIPYVQTAVLMRKD